MLDVAGEVCKYTEQSENRALKLSRLDLARLQRSRRCREVWLASWNPPLSNMAVIDRPWCAKKKYFSPASSSRARYSPYPRAELGSLSFSRSCFARILKNLHTFTWFWHIKRRPFVRSCARGTSVLLNVICCRIPRGPCRISPERRRKPTVVKVECIVSSRKKPGAR